MLDIWLYQPLFHSQFMQTQLRFTISIRKKKSESKKCLQSKKENKMRKPTSRARKTCFRLWVDETWRARSQSRVNRQVSVREREGSLLKQKVPLRIGLKKLLPFINFY